MQLLFDNLIAIIVAASLALLLLTQQNATRQDTMERQAVYSAKTQALTFSEWLERDVVKLGARFGSDRDRFVYTPPTTRGGIRFSNRFEFFYNEGENPDSTADRIAVLYTLVRTDSVKIAVVPDRYQPLYQLQRFEGAGRWSPKRRYWVDAAGRQTTPPAYVRTPGYGSPAGLTSFYMEPRTSDGAPITDQARAVDADYMHMQFSVLPTLFPIYRARYINASGMSWSSTFEIRPF